MPLPAFGFANAQSAMRVQVIASPEFEVTVRLSPAILEVNLAPLAPVIDGSRVLLLYTLF